MAFTATAITTTTSTSEMPLAAFVISTVATEQKRLDN
jgi:hypothetical protein